MARTLIVHIGMPKTGSTYIQRALRGAGPELARHGVRVAETGRTWSGGHNRLVSALSGDWTGGSVLRATSGMWYELAEELCGSRAHTQVLTTELFTAAGMLTRTPSSTAVRYLGELVDRCALEPRLVAYVRPQYALLESLYSQSAKKSRCTYGFDAFVEDLLAEGLLDFNKVFAPWRERFGKRLEVWPLDPGTMPEGLFAHFLGHVGVSAISPEPLARANVREGAKTLEVKRLVGVALKATGVPFKQRGAHPEGAGAVAGAAGAGCTVCAVQRRRGAGADEAVRGVQ